MSKIRVRIAAMILSVVGPSLAGAQSFTENFDDITLLAGNGWVMQNNSVPVGSINWFQGTPTSATPNPGPFNAFNGADNAYIAANYNNTGNTGTISNWLMTPNRTLRNGDVLAFYTRKVTPDSYADRLEVRLSTNGASTNAGTNATTVGDFTTLLLSVNPNLVLGVYPTTWTQYTITMSGLPAPTSGRMAFRYFVTGAGALGTNSDYIGIDNVGYAPYVCPAITLSGTPGNGIWFQPYNISLGETGALGTPNYAVTAGALPPGLTLSASGAISGTPTATGTFNFTVTVSDNSGCSGSQAYSITIAADVPSAPLNVGATPGDAQASVSWVTPASDGGDAISGYTATCTDGTNNFNAPSSASPVTVSGLVNGTAYTCTVTATNGAGTGPASAASNGFMPMGTQTITFNNPGAQTFGTTPTLSATASSGLIVSFTSATTGVCTITSGGALTFVTLGTCTINADQPGNTAIGAAPQVQRSFEVIDWIFHDGFDGL